MTTQIVQNTFSIFRKHQCYRFLISTVRLHSIIAIYAQFSPATTLENLGTKNQHMLRINARAHSFQLCGQYAGHASTPLTTLTKLMRPDVWLPVITKACITDREDCIRLTG